MLQISSTIINASIETEHLLKRYLTSIVVMTEKVPNTHRINKLRVINIYEVDYTLLLKFFWQKNTTQHAEVNDYLGENQ